MKRLAEMLKAGPPDLSGSAGPVSAGPVAAGGVPSLPSSAEEFDQESAAELLAILGDFFRKQHKESGEEAGAGPSERE